MSLLEYEAWINKWSHSWNVHVGGKGQACHLCSLPLTVPSAPSEAIQRLHIENGAFIKGVMMSNPWLVPCAKGMCSDQPPVAYSEFRQFWCDLFIEAFSEPLAVNYVLQSREDWIILMELIVCVFEDQKHKVPEKQQTLLSNITTAMECVLHKPSNYDATQVLKAVDSYILSNDLIEITYVARFARAAVALSSEAVVKSWFESNLSPLILSVCAQTLFDSWRSTGVIGSAAAQKLVKQVLRLASPLVLLETLRRIILNGGGACLTSYQSLEEQLKSLIVGKDAPPSFEIQYKATLLMSELFPRQAWPEIGLLLSRLEKPVQFLPLLYSAFALHDLESLLELLPQDYLLLVDSPDVYTVCRKRSDEMTKAEAQKLLKYAESKLKQHPITFSLSWLGIVLCILHYTSLVLSSSSLLKICEVLESQDKAVGTPLIISWAACMNDFYNGSLRNSEMQLTILKSGPGIPYFPEGTEELTARCEDLCARWKTRAPRVITALEDRLKLSNSSQVFGKVKVSSMNIGSPDAALKLGQAKELTDVNDLEQACENLKVLIGKPDEWLVENNVLPDGLRNLYSGWHHLVVKAEAPDAIRLFDKHSYMVMHTSQEVLARLCQIICKVGNKCATETGEDSLYACTDRVLCLQRLLESCLSLVIQAVGRPPRPYGCFINNLWFDQQFCPQLREIYYIVKAAAWFYTDEAAPLTLKVMLSEVFAQLIAFMPKNFSHAKLRTEPLDKLIAMLKRNHKKVKEQLQNFNMVSDTVACSEEMEHQRKLIVVSRNVLLSLGEIVAYILSSIGE